MTDFETVVVVHPGCWERVVVGMGPVPMRYAAGSLEDKAEGFVRRVEAALAGAICDLPLAHRRMVVEGLLRRVVLGEVELDELIRRVEGLAVG